MLALISLPQSYFLDIRTPYSDSDPESHNIYYVKEPTDVVPKTPSYDGRHPSMDGHTSTGD
jgi:hypothetical protein